MEGLLPLVYKSIKKSTTRRHYEYLGSGTAAAAAQSYNIADFYANGDQVSMTPMKGQYAAPAAAAAQHHHHHHHHEMKVSDHGFGNINDEENFKGRQEFHHRRYKSFSVDYGGSFTPDTNRTGTAPSKKLVRFRSHRFFSCVTGA